MKNLRLNDAHLHFFSNGYPGKYGALFPDGREFVTYEAIRKVHQIDQALVVGYEGEPWAKGNNAYIAKLAREHAWVKPLAFCATEAPLSVGRLEKWWADGFYGLSFYVFDASGRDRLLQASDRWIESLNQKRAILSINTSPKIARELRPFWERLGQAQILISHLGLPGSMASASKKIQPVLSLADLPQIGVKLSAFYAANAYPHSGLASLIDQLTTAFTSSRLYWGSDFAPGLDFVTFAQTIDALNFLLKKRLMRRTIFGENLRNLINRVE